MRGRALLLGVGVLGAGLLSGCTGLAELQSLERRPVAQCPAPEDPGRVTLHRLNRAEYDATVRDLLGDTSQPARDFPDDLHGHGFDNNADVLSLSPLLMEKYATAAERLVAEAWARDAEALQSGAEPRVRICTLEGEDAQGCARSLLARFARRAWRRPVADEEVERLMRVALTPVQSGDTLEEGVQLALETVLLSPNFLFRRELDPDPTSLEPHRVSDVELASRLSYFLWSSAPDEELLQSAEAGRLHEPEELRRQVDRMLADGRAEALVQNFAGQWLYTRALAEVTPDAVRFPGFDPALREAMRQETEGVFRAFLHEDRKARELLDADFTFLNDRLAAHYGLPPVGSDVPQRVPLVPGTERAGLLGHGSLLTVTSMADRTSPTRRGRWVLQQLLCETVPAPPPGVEGLATTTSEGLSVRERMEQHATNPACASCHQAMDPIGFGLENFDAVGAWRLADAQTGGSIDASGRLPDGTTFQGVTGLRGLLREDPRLPGCISRQLLTYALGRGLTESDTCLVDAATRSAEARGGRLTDFIHAVVESPLFTHRRGEPEEGP